MVKPMDANDLLNLVCETNFGYLTLGNEVFQTQDASFIRNHNTPRRFDANGAGLIRTAAPDEIESLLQRAEAEYAALQHRHFLIDALTPPQVAGRIALEQGYKATDTLVHALEGDLRLAAGPGATSRPAIEVREVLSEDDWATYRALDAMWWKETSTAYLGPYDSSLHDEFMVYHRNKTPQVWSWFACVDGVPRAFLSSWPGENGAGIIEDLFCHPEYRHRGLATALIAHCVADCRERGAGPVIINSDVNDTPKQMYAAMGFRPLFVQRTYTKRLDENRNPRRERGVSLFSGSQPPPCNG